MIPTTLMTVLSLIGIIYIGYYAVQIGWYLFTEWWKHRTFEVENEYALHSRENNYEVKFITNGRDYR